MPAWLDSIEGKMDPLDGLAPRKFSELRREGRNGYGETSPTGLNELKSAVGRHSGLPDPASTVRESEHGSGAQCRESGQRGAGRG